MLKMYDAPETATSDSRHTLKLKFQWGEHTAEVVTTMGGNVYGAELLAGYGDFDIGFTAPQDNEINKKHCVFEEGSEHNYAEVEAIRFYHPTRPEEEVDIVEAGGYLVGIEIIAYEEDRDDN